MVNAFHIHNQEFDCVHERAVVHPMAVILATLFAIAERESVRQKNISGAAFLAALALAVDVATTIGMCATKPLRFFRPAMCGCLGAAAGAALLKGLNKEQMRDAFGIAYSQLAGTMQAHVEGTPALALQVAFAARAAVCAVDLAAEGNFGWATWLLCIVRSRCRTGRRICGIGNGLAGRARIAQTISDRACGARWYCGTARADG
jgi:2-methylcitrate dehydratase PrpD